MEVKSWLVGGKVKRKKIKLRILGLPGGRKECGGDTGEIESPSHKSLLVPHSATGSSLATRTAQSFPRNGLSEQKES